MYAKLKINLIGLAAALSFVLVGFSLGEPPRAQSASPGAAPALVQADDASELTAPGTAPEVTRRGALKRHLAMPYVSFAALLPRQES